MIKAKSRTVGVVLAACLVMGWGVAQPPAEPGEAGGAWPFFAFDNGVGRGVWPPAVQAETVKTLGYEGIHYNYTNPKDFAAKLGACRAAGVPIVAVYFYTHVGKTNAPYDPGIKEVIRMLEGTETILWMTLCDGKPGQQDAEAAAVVRDIAAQAAASGLRVSLYPHAGFYVATAEDAVRVVKAANLPNVGVTVNLCHELFAGNAGRLGEVLERAGPHLNLVSINGASPIPGKGPKAWDTLPLGSGSFDTDGFLRLVRDAGYRGPIGHQFYGVKGDDKEKLTLAIRAWKAAKARLLPAPRDGAR
ncbi:MAG TPA: sugar phosphate isomerase/epimerase family protein [Verrucomicrobiota bacterium]|nr:sugar phosphate isomerase/epimerase family protein [Verrucomicrobiota bacterium]HNU50498.1 sugar phosphate isomerase/epimerase family protein [Verrucomicrobiota bacterium]